jgi:hypothetical protein
VAVRHIAVPSPTRSFDPRMSSIPRRRSVLLGPGRFGRMRTSPWRLWSSSHPCGRVRGTVTACSGLPGFSRTRRACPSAKSRILRSADQLRTGQRRDPRLAVPQSGHRALLAADPPGTRCLMANVIAASEAMTTAATDLATIGSDLNAAHLVAGAPTAGLTGTSGIATATWRERLASRGISRGRGNAMTAVVLYPRIPGVGHHGYPPAVFDRSAGRTGPISARLWVPDRLPGSRIPTSCSQLACLAARFRSHRWLYAPRCVTIDL